MKLKITPLIIVTAALVAFGIYCIFSGSNLGPPEGFIFIFLGAVVLLPHFLFRVIFKANIWRQIIAELVLLSVIYFFIYKFNGEIILHPEKNYKGYIYVVYGVNKAPELRTRNIFEHNIDVNVNTSGILFTSGKRPGGWFNRLAVADSSNGKVTFLVPGYGVIFANDTLRCGGKKYLVDVFLMGKQMPQWRFMTDTLNRGAKMKQACELLRK